MTGSKLRRLGAAALLVAASAAVAGTGHQWNNFRWTDGNVQAKLKLSYKFSTDSDTPWVTYYKGAIAKWNAGSTTYGTPLSLIDLNEASGTTGLECKPIVGEILVCSADYGGSEGWVGIAEIDWAAGSNKISWATAKFNDYYYNTDSPYYRTYGPEGQKLFVACHEIGHTFGLGHLDTSFYNKNKGSCMDYTANTAGPPSNEDPGAVDWQVLNSPTMYGNYTSTKGGKPGGGGGGRPLEPVGNADPFQFREVGASAPEPQGNAYGRFGKIFEYDDAGRPVAFVRDLPNGHTRVTYVTWAKDHRPQGSK